MAASRLIILSLLMLGTTPLRAAEGPVRISAEEAKGAIFSSPKAVISRRGAADTKWVEMLRSKDETMSAGIYEATASRSEIASYGEDEFMYFLKGGVTLTSADGTVTEVEAGDAVTIPKGWKGVWDTKGYTKFYVTYTPK